MTGLTLWPIARVVAPSSTTSFRVRVADGNGVSVQVHACADAVGYQLHFTNGQPDAPLGVQFVNMAR